MFRSGLKGPAVVIPISLKNLLRFVPDFLKEAFHCDLQMKKMI